ncbi:MAG TPA: thermonuclease family protein [Alphaproteobacteria bacterium]|nr:thermonuclease family protein [Alphaproteobacteria bacterium]
MALILAMFPLGMAYGQGATSDSGPATVIDGSTLTVSGVTYYFVGVLAPALKQTCYKNDNKTVWPCGEAAAEELHRLIDGRSVRCASVGRDGAGHNLGVCYAGELELNRAMVASGMAVIRWQLGLDYTEVQAEAKTARIGLWQGNFVDPAEWRSQHEPNQNTAPPPPS